MSCPFGKGENNKKHTFPPLWKIPFLFPLWQRGIQGDFIDSNYLLMHSLHLLVQPGRNLRMRYWLAKKIALGNVTAGKGKSVQYFLILHPLGYHL